MIERRATWGYWMFNGPIHRGWQLTMLHIDNYVNFDCFQYKINGVIYKKHTKKFQEAREKELLWEKLK